MAMGERLDATVLEWNDRGFGFIGLADGRRAYVHHSQFGGGNLQKGEAVSAVIVEDRQNPGKLAAQDVQRGSDQASEPRLQGVVTQWNPRGFGFIQVADGRRAYVHASQFQGESLQEGENVSAYITEDAANPGKWAATDVQREGQASGKGAGQGLMEGGAFSPGKGGKQGMPFMAPMMHQMSSMVKGKGAPFKGAPAGGYDAPNFGASLQAASTPGYWGAGDGPMGGSDQRYEGTVEEWNDRGFGFIKLEDGRRVYVHHSSFGGGNLQPGLIVNCSVVEDKANAGKWAAADVQLGRLKLGMNPPGLSPASAFGHKGKGWPQAPMWAPSPVKRMPAQPFGFAAPGRLEGRVAQWSERGYGFIEFPDGRRAYVHSSAFGGGDLAMGETVTCNIDEDAQNPGKWCAKNVQRAPVGEDGEVSSWNAQGGFGFLTMLDGRRAYIHASFVGGGDLEVGKRLRVLTKPDPRNPGKFSVAEVLEQFPSAANEGPPNFQSASPSPFAEAPQNRFAEVPQSNMGNGSEGPFTGSVAEWDQRGFGFVLLEDGRRAYVHYSAFGSGNLLVGEPVTVTVVPDRRNVGKLMVKEMVREEGAVEAVAEEAHLANAEGPAAKRNRLI